MSKRRPAVDMSPEHRYQEVAAILARGVLCYRSMARRAACSAAQESADRRIGPLALILHEQGWRGVEQLDRLLFQRAVQQNPQLQRLEDRSPACRSGTPGHTLLLLSHSRGIPANDMARPDSRCTLLFGPQYTTLVKTGKPWAPDGQSSGRRRRSPHIEPRSWFPLLGLACRIKRVNDAGTPNTSNCLLLCQPAALGWTAKPNSEDASMPEISERLRTIASLIRAQGYSHDVAEEAMAILRDFAPGQVLSEKHGLVATPTTERSLPVGFDFEMLKQESLTRLLHGALRLLHAVICVCESERLGAVNIPLSPRLFDKRQEAFRDGQPPRKLRELATQLDRLMQGETAPTPSHHSDTAEFNVPPAQGEWSPPMSKAEIARRLAGDREARGRLVDALVRSNPQTHQIRSLGGNRWQIRLDTLDRRTRGQIEKEPG